MCSVDEQFFGFGQQFTYLSATGRVLPLFVREQVRDVWGTLGNKHCPVVCPCNIYLFRVSAEVSSPGPTSSIWVRES